MRKSLLIMGAMAAAACGTIAAPAGAASAESAASTIQLLEAQGFEVKLDRIGSAPLSQCVVTDVRNPRDETRLVRVSGDHLVPVVVKRKITVSLDCSR
jgi:hypothetical protein